MEQLSPEVCSHIFFYVQSLDDVIQVTTFMVFMALGKRHSLKKFKSDKYFVNKPEHLMYSQLPLKMSLLQGNKCWSAFTMGKTGKTLIPYAKSNSVIRSVERKRRTKYSLTCLQHQKN